MQFIKTNLRQVLLLGIAHTSRVANSVARKCQDQGLHNFARLQDGYCAPATTSTFQTRSRRKKTKRKWQYPFQEHEPSPEITIHLLPTSHWLQLLHGHLDLSERLGNVCIFLSCALCCPKQNCSSGRGTLTSGRPPAEATLCSRSPSLGCPSLLFTYWNLIHLVRVQWNVTSPKFFQVSQKKLSLSILQFSKQYLGCLVNARPY